MQSGSPRSSSASRSSRGQTLRRQARPVARRTAGRSARTSRHRGPDARRRCRRRAPARGRLTGAPAGRRAWLLTSQVNGKPESHLIRRRTSRLTRVSTPSRRGRRDRFTASGSGTAQSPLACDGIRSLGHGLVTVAEKSRRLRWNVGRGRRSSALYLTCVVTCRPVAHRASGLTGRRTRALTRICTRQQKEVS